MDDDNAVAALHLWKLQPLQGWLSAGVVAVGIVFHGHVDAIVVIAAGNHKESSDDERQV